jgi:hypothetical protein
LGKYKSRNGSPVTSSKQLSNWQLDDLLAICESQGWRYPGRPDDFFRKKRARESTYPDRCARYAQQEAIKYLAGDLGWRLAQVCGLAERILGKKGIHIVMLTPGEAYKVIEALKAILGRERDKTYANLNEVMEDMEADKDVEACPF